MSASRRISLSLPVELTRQLDFVSGRMGLSRSALVSALLSQGLPTMVDLLQSVPANPKDATPSERRRFRGIAAKSIANEIEGLFLLAGESQDDLFSK